MALPFRNSTNNGVVGLDIDGQFLAAVQTADGTIARGISTELPPGVVSEGEVTDSEALATTLKQFFADAGLPRKVRLGVANQQIVVRQITLPLIENAAERDVAVRFQSAEAIAMPLDEAILDHHVVGEGPGPDGGAAVQTIVVVAARRSMIEGLVEAVRSAGLKPEGIDLDAFALVRVLARESEPDGMARVFCHLGAVTNLAIAFDRRCLFTRPLSTAWATQGERRASGLADEIRISLDYYMSQPAVEPAGGLVLSGPGSDADGLAEELSGLVGLPTVVADPLGALDTALLADGEDPHRHTVAAGLALGAAA